MHRLLHWSMVSRSDSLYAQPSTHILPEGQGPWAKKKNILQTQRLCVSVFMFYCLNIHICLIVPFKQTHYFYYTLYTKKCVLPALFKYKENIKFVLGFDWSPAQCLWW